MLVDLGNLLFIGKYNGCFVVGLLGCVWLFVFNGVDWVLEWVICGEIVVDVEIVVMGVGGLFKEILMCLSFCEG